jgi:hypothetical protein
MAKNFPNFLNFTHRPKFWEDNVLSGLWTEGFGRKKRGALFLPNEPNRLLKTKDVFFW